MASEKKKVIKRKIDLDVVSSLDRDLKDKLLEFYTDTLNSQEQRKRDKRRNKKRQRNENKRRKRKEKW